MDGSIMSHPSGGGREAMATSAGAAAAAPSQDSGGSLEQSKGGPGSGINPSMLFNSSFASGGAAGGASSKQTTQTGGGQRRGSGSMDYEGEENGEARSSEERLMDDDPVDPSSGPVRTKQEGGYKHSKTPIPAPVKAACTYCRSR